MTAEPDPGRRLHKDTSPGTTACLHVVDGQRDWLLPAHQIGAVLKAPAVQPLPTLSIFSGLVTHRRSVHTALRLSRVWSSPEDSSGAPEATPAGAGSGWGLVFGPGGGKVVLLVEDVVGNVDVDHQEMEWLKGAPDEPLLGLRGLPDGTQLYIDPLRSPLLLGLACAEDEHPWLDLRSLARPDEQRSSPPRGVELVIVVEDQGHVLGLPARSVFSMDRVAPREEAPPAPRLKDLISGAGPKAAQGATRPPSFCCRIGSPAGYVEASFDDLLMWRSIDTGALRTWPAMAQHSLAGAFTMDRADGDEAARDGAGPSPLVLMVDPARLLARRRRGALSARPRRRTRIFKEARFMSSDLSRAHVCLHASERQVALPMSCIRSLSSWRRSRIHAIGVAHRAIVGILERAGQCSTVVDLGVLLQAEAVEPGPASRLVTVDTASGLMTLLADSISAPFEVEPSSAPAAPGVPAPGAAAPLFAGDVSVEGGARVPLLDLAAVLAALGEGSADA